MTTENTTAPESITEIVNDFYDILYILGKSMNEVVPWPRPVNKSQRYVNACAKIDAITEVYNEGPLDFTNRNQRKYYLYFQRTSEGWVFCAVCDCLYSAYLGSGCYFRSEALARDAYAKFMDIWHDYLPE